jgi:hypothetical protein
MMILASATESAITSHQKSQGPADIRQPLIVEGIRLLGAGSTAFALAGQGVYG